MGAILAIAISGALWRPQGPWIAVATVAGLGVGYLFAVLNTPGRGGDGDESAAQSTVGQAEGSVVEAALGPPEIPAAQQGVEACAPASTSNDRTMVARLAGANLNGARLRGADLRGLDLRGTDLRNADLSGADLSNAQLGDDIEN